MNHNIASQIVELLKQNELTIDYTPEMILNTSENYVFIEEHEKIMACAEVKKVQWYQWEISHVSVAKRRCGFGKRIVELAESKIIKAHGKVIQCTIRSTNTASIELFKSMGYTSGVTFYNANSGNNVIIFQKALSN